MNGSCYFCGTTERLLYFTSDEDICERCLSVDRDPHRSIRRLKSDNAALRQRVEELEARKVVIEAAVIERDGVPVFVPRYQSNGERWDHRLIVSANLFSPGDFVEVVVTKSPSTEQGGQG